MLTMFYQQKEHKFLTYINRYNYCFIFGKLQFEIAKFRHKIKRKIVSLNILKLCLVFYRLRNIFFGCLVMIKQFLKYITLKGERYYTVTECHKHKIELNHKRRNHKKRTFVSLNFF